MHPIQLLLNATLGTSGARWASGLWTAGVLIALLAVTGALLGSGAFSSGATPADLGGLAQDNGTAVPAPGGVAAVTEEGSAEVRLEDWEYTGKPISPAIVRTKKKLP